jgi:arginine N-succinyltransferase
MTTPATPTSPEADPQVVVRPVALSDLAALLELASLAGAGLTTLPKDESVLEARIAKSLKTFERLPRSPNGETYLFVMETHPGGKVIGASGIVSKVGGFEPFYSYIIENTLFESRWINVRREVPILRLHEEHDGPCEIGSLFLHPEHRGNRNGRFLQLVRFLFMAEHSEAFEKSVVSEIRGVSDDAGRSPFWDAIGRHFFGIDFSAADHLSVTNKKFIADLMPDHPIYIPLLPREAQDVIGVCHEHSRPAVKNLEVEGFTYQHAVDIFDAGPVYACPRDHIRSVRESRRGVVAEVVRQLDTPPYMMGTTTEAFRAVKGPLLELPGTSPSSPTAVRISADSARALGVRMGESLRYVALLPSKPGAPE